MRETLGTGPEGHAVLPAYEALMQQQDAAKWSGKILCRCRERRGDPHREDCEFLYPRVIP